MARTGMILAFSDRYYQEDPLVRLALPTVVLLSISPPSAAEGLLRLVRDVSQLWPAGS